MNEEQKKAFETIKTIYEEGEASVNGRVYTFTKMVHKERKKVFAFASAHQNELDKGNFSCLDHSDFEPVEKIIHNRVMFNGELLSRREDHWEEYPEDYVWLVAVAMQVMSYPFIKGGITG